MNFLKKISAWFWGLQLAWKTVVGLVLLILFVVLYYQFCSDSSPVENINEPAIQEQTDNMRRREEQRLDNSLNRSTNTLDTTANRDRQSQENTNAALNRSFENSNLSEADKNRCSAFPQSKGCPR